MTDYDFAQAVMKAAGVEPDCKMCLCNHERLSHDGLTGPCAACECQEWLEGEHIYPCPMTSGDGFLALWEGMNKKGFYVRVISNPSGFSVAVWDEAATYSGRAGVACEGMDFRMTLVEAAGRALGVTR